MILLTASRLWRPLVICLVLSGCSNLFTKPPPSQIYDVRSAVVLSGPNIPRALLAGIADRVNAAIAATVRDTPLPRVVVTIRVVTVEKEQGYQKDRNSAKIEVNAASVDNGEVIAVSSFEVTTIASDPKLIDEIMAEDVAARIRAIFSLNTPPGR